MIHNINTSFFHKISTLIWYNEQLRQRRRKKLKIHFYFIYYLKFNFLTFFFFIETALYCIFNLIYSFKLCWIIKIYKQGKILEFLSKFCKLFDMWVTFCDIFRSHNENHNQSIKKQIETVWNDYSYEFTTILLT